MALKAEIQSTLPSKTLLILGNFWGMAITYLVTMLVLRMVGLVFIFSTHSLSLGMGDVLVFSLFDDLNWFLYFTGLLLIFHVIISLFSMRVAKWFSQLIFTLALLIHAALTIYFQKTLVPLGKDLFGYSYEDLLFTVQASGQINFLNGLLAAGVVVFVLILLHMGIYFFRFGIKTYFVVTIATYWFLIVLNLFPRSADSEASELKRNIELNKSRYLSEQSFDYFMYADEYYFDFYLRSAEDGISVKKTFLDDAYPFLHEADYPDVLSPYFDSLTSAPDIVFILVESLGKAYSGSGAELGSFTPFLDSLEHHSLVWTNALSSTGRTFGLLPGIFGGLPFGEKGFLEMYQNFPHHNSLISILRANRYETSYFIGSDKAFDNQGAFITYQKVDQLVDVSGFDPKYPKAPSKNGFSWGYADKDLFSNTLEKLPGSDGNPQLRIIQTQTSHDPYIVPDRPFYLSKLQNHLQTKLRLNQEQLSRYMAYQDVYMTILYADDAVKEFITAYSKRPEFANTIFVITGDHRLPEIPMSTRLDRFHVPLLIYSPMIKRPSYFKGITSHFEVTPSLLAFLKGQLGIEVPRQAVWLGQVLDTASTFQSTLSMPLMRNKNQLLDYIDGEYFLSEGQLFLISDGLGIEPVTDNGMQNRLNGLFEDFKNKNSYMVQTRKLLP